MEEKKYNIKVVNPFVPIGPYRDGLHTPLLKIFPFLNERKKTDLLHNKLMLEKADATESKYIQSACELTICSWFAAVAVQAGGKYEYEPVIARPKDVDCAIFYDGHKFNIEVKCADYQKQKDIVADSELVVHGLGRLDDYGEFVSRLQGLFGKATDQPVLRPAHHMDCKLKDYLISAQGKFGTKVLPGELNILFVCVDDQMDMTKWISYLNGPRGLFASDSFEPHQSYDNVDLVVFSNLYHRHSNVEAKDKISEHWNLGRAFNFAVINPRSTKSDELFSRFSALLPLENQYLYEFLQKSAIPDGLGNALGLSYFVVEQKEEGVHKFQGYPVDDSQSEE